ncbi:MAG: hypothetical protein HC831_18480 [Chloroflexia bacterium]|nr:hypothetical protein [Chloroflexia bacterium]
MDPSRLGTTIFVNPFKQRFARPIKIQLHIPYYKPPNPYVGLEKFISWDIGGVMRGNILSEKEYEKLTPAQQKKCGLMEKEEIDKKSGDAVMVKYYAQPNDKAHSIVLRDKCDKIPVKELWSDKVFTEEVLREMDEKIIKKTFQLPDIFSLEDEQADLQEWLNSDDETDMDVDNDTYGEDQSEEA